MLKKLVFLTLIAFLAAACPQKKEMDWKNTYWILTNINGEALITGSEDRPIYLHLPEGPNGKVEGFAGCNHFFGTCAIDENQVQFSRMASTKMMCPRMKTEQALLSALEIAKTYRVKKTKIELLGKGLVLASFVVSEEKP